MKKFLSLCLLAASIVIFGPHKQGFCQPTESDLRDKTVQICYKLSVAANVSTSSIVIDLVPVSTTTTAWPHVPYGTGQLNLTSIDLEIDKAAASTCTVRLGVVTFVDASTGTVVYFEGLNNENNVSNTNNRLTVWYDNQFKNLKANPATAPQTDGTTPNLMSNISTSGSTAFQTDVVMPTLSGSFLSPALGDIILSAVNGTNAIVVYLYLNYHSDIR